MTQQTVADIIQRGTNGARPVATAVVAGTLYYDTTNSQLTRSNGTTWDVVEPASLSNPMTTAGDIIVGDTGGTPIRLAKGSDSTVLTVSASTHLPVWQAAAGGAPTTTPYITTASDAGLSAEVAIPGLAASADIKGAGGAGTAEEYDTGTTGLSWTPSTPSTVDSNTTILSNLYVASTDGTERIGTKSWSPAGALDARIRVHCGASTVASGSAGSFGLHIGDSGNNNRVLVNTGGSNSIAALTYASSTYTQRGGSTTWIGSVVLRITRDGSNNWSFYWSPDGVIWHFIATQALTFTVANIGYRSANAAHEAAVDWLRTSV